MTVKETNIAPPDGIVVFINNYQIECLSGNVVKDNVTIPDVFILMSDKQWFANMKNCTVKITELWVKTTGDSISKIVFELIPEDTKITLYGDVVPGSRQGSPMTTKIN